MLSSSYYLSPFFLSFLLTVSLPPFSQSSSSLLLIPHSSPSTSSLPLSLLPLLPTHCPSPSSSSLIPLHPSSSLPLSPSSPSFLSILLLTTSLPPSFPSSSSLPLSLLLPLLYFSPSLLSSSYYLSPFFLSLLLTASLPPSSQSSSLFPLHSPPHYLSPSFLSYPHYLSPSFFLFSTYLPPCSPLLTTSLPSSSPSYSLPLSLLLLPHSSLSILLTTSLPSSSQSSSLPLSLLPLSHPHHLSILHSFQSPPHYLSSLSCNIIIHLITSVFLPSPSSLLTLPNYLLRILFSSVVIIILLITSSSLLLFSSFTFVTSSFLSSSFKFPLQYLFHYFLIIILLTISILFHIDSLPNSTPSSSLFYTFSISPSSPSSFYHSPSVFSILLIIFLPSCPLPHTCQLCLPALSKLEFFSLALRKIALSLRCFSHPFLLPPYPFSLHVHACLSYYYHHC